MKSLRTLAIFAALTVSALGQSATPAPISTNSREIPMLRVQLPGGTYAVALRSIISVSQHEYLVDGIARVTEVNIDTAGTLLARFYFLEPAVSNTPAAVVNAAADQAQRLLKEAADKTGQDVWKKVTKTYPTTTHARTAEYRVDSLETLGKIFTAADQALRLQKDTRLSLGSE